METWLVFPKSPALQLNCQQDIGFTMKDTSKVGEGLARRQESREKGGSQR